MDYFRSINYAERYIGKMIDKIEVSGHAEDTMIIFASDHGDMIGKHGLNLKMSFYDAAIKVPLLIDILGEWNKGERGGRPVMLLITSTPAGFAKKPQIVAPTALSSWNAFVLGLIMARLPSI
tara:strand:- start:61 stop:426 length:366 start_codon:yes stop_codon:yes gene_type:complete